MKDFGPAYGVANAVLYEGYLLFPYTASAAKNRVRWQFGVVVPERYLAAGTGEHADQQTEVLVAHDGAPDIDVLLRFLQVEARTVEVAHGNRFDPARAFTVGNRTYVSFDEAVERELLVRIAPGDAAHRVAPLRVDGGRDIDELRDDDGVVVARIVRERWPIAGSLTIDVEPLRGDGPTRCRAATARPTSAKCGPNRPARCWARPRTAARARSICSSAIRCRAFARPHRAAAVRSSAGKRRTLV